MNRREVITRAAFTTGAVAIGGPAVLLQIACDRKAVEAWADQAINAFVQAEPFIRDLLPGSVAVLAKAIAVAKDLRAALKTKADNAIDFVRQLITGPDSLFEQIAKSVGLIKNANQRRIVSGILALAGIALNLIAAQLDSEADAHPALAAKARAAQPEAFSAVQAIADSDKLERALAAVRP